MASEAIKFNEIMNLHSAAIAYLYTKKISDLVKGAEMESMF